MYGPPKPKNLELEGAPLADNKKLKSDAIAALEAQLKKTREGLQSELADKKQNLKEQVSLIEAAKEHNELSSLEELSAKRQIAATVRDEERNTFSSDLDALRAYYKKRIKLGFENGEEEKKFKSEYAKQVSETVRKEETEESEARIADRRAGLDGEKLIGQEQERLGRALVESFIAEREIEERTQKEIGRADRRASDERPIPLRRVFKITSSTIIRSIGKPSSRDRKRTTPRVTIWPSRGFISSRGNSRRSSTSTSRRRSKSSRRWKKGDAELAKTLIRGDGSTVSDKAIAGGRP